MAYELTSPCWNCGHDYPLNEDVCPRCDKHADDEPQETNYYDHQDDPALSWYKALSLVQKFALKALSVDICGMRWEDFTLLFSPRERIQIIHNKLRIEGLIL